MAVITRQLMAVVKTATTDRVRVRRILLGCSLVSSTPSPPDSPGMKTPPVQLERSILFSEGLGKMGGNVLQ